ncbi:related to siroheme synthase [Melanopsichium pennsylvanicum]|uniref:precorrin-2 dehydrogenase n=2 Tax=Melanopsichium pennsylvanicum TaxID=63383 RepID=A0AAJ4XGM5_9BASI|nr:related to siroheme synthase [Melanopsichium pennsylvanicum 4]SNX81783.1 related to siroheme synthase [Melanopsichium pennsylvanicum]
MASRNPSQCPVTGQTADEGQNYPKICPGGGLLLAWQLKGKNVLIVGGGPVAAGRLVNVLDADAIVTVVCPQSGLCSEMAYRINTQKVVHQHIDTEFDPSTHFSMLDQFAMVLTAIDDVNLSKQICYRCRDLRIPVNVADVPPECDFYFGSLIRNGPLQVMVSTGGQGPKIASQTRQKIQAAIPKNVGQAISNVGKLRGMLRKKVPEVEMGARRMRWMIEVCEKWNLDEICEMNQDDMEKVLAGWENGYVPSYKQVKGKWISDVRWKKALFGKCPVVGYSSPYLSGLIGVVVGATAATAVLLGRGFRTST